MSKTVEQLEAIIQNVIENVMDYDGCIEGKRDFLESCGIELPKVDVVVEVAFTTVAGTTWNDLVETVQSALDQTDVVAGNSAYVVGGRNIDCNPHQFLRNLPEVPRPDGMR